jgi:hypothetical protein
MRLKVTLLTASDVSSFTFPVLDNLIREPTFLLDRDIFLDVVDLQPFSFSLALVLVLHLKKGIP